MAQARTTCDVRTAPLRVLWVPAQRQGAVPAHAVLISDSGAGARGLAVRFGGCGELAGARRHQTKLGGPTPFPAISFLPLVSSETRGDTGRVGRKRFSVLSDSGPRAAGSRRRSVADCSWSANGFFLERERPQRQTMSHVSALGAGRHSSPARQPSRRRCRRAAASTCGTGEPAPGPVDRAMIKP